MLLRNSLKGFKSKPTYAIKTIGGKVARINSYFQFNRIGNLCFLCAQIYNNLHGVNNHCILLLLTSLFSKQPFKTRMKDSVKLVLQKIFGFSNYLFIFSVFKIRTLKHDKNERDFLYFLKLIPENSTVFDIGANIGIMTVYLAQKFKNFVVYSFEPMPDNITALKRVVNHFKLSNVTIIETALGEKSGELEMVMPVRNNVKFQGLSHAVHESIPDNNEGLRFKVPVQMLDEIPAFKNLKQPLTAIKIDVENFEYFVLKGGENLLIKYKPLVYAELWDNENRNQCFSLMTTIGYQIKVLLNDNLVAFDNSKHKHQNFFFVFEK